MDIKQKTAEISKRLVEHYGVYSERKGKPFDVLINTILSQNTTDRNSSIAFETLFKVYNTPEQLANAPEDEIAELIKYGGLNKIKAKRIKDISRLILEEYGGNIDFVCEIDPEAARKEMLSIEGVGPKTADCVLLFSCKQDVIPVDTHVFRITKRLGIVPQGANHEEVHRILTENVPAGQRGSVHVALIKFGREICKAQNPQHDHCFLIDLCDHARMVGAYPQKNKLKK
jgi:endonuclease III